VKVLPLGRASVHLNLPWGCHCSLPIDILSASKSEGRAEKARVLEAAISTFREHSSEPSASGSKACHVQR
jgi:hypothetical protein